MTLTKELDITFIPHELRHDPKSHFRTGQMTCTLCGEVDVVRNEICVIQLKNFILQAVEEGSL